MDLVFSMFYHVIEIQWVVDFYFISEMALQPNFRNMILELILKICKFKLIYEKENVFQWLLPLTVYIKIKFQIN